MRLCAAARVIYPFPHSPFPSRSFSDFIFYCYFIFYKQIICLLYIYFIFYLFLLLFPCLIFLVSTTTKSIFNRRYVTIPLPALYHYHCCFDFVYYKHFIYSPVFMRVFSSFGSVLDVLKDSFFFGTFPF